MAITTTQAQGLVLALFGASAGGHLTGLAAASNLNTLAGDLSTSAGLILGKDLSSNTAFRDHITANLKLSGDALTAANAWLDGQLNAGAARGDIIATAVTFLSTLTDTTSPFYASAQAFQSTVTAAVAWSTGAGATVFGVAALRAEQGNVEVIPGSSFTLTTGTDTIVGTAGNDTITASGTTYATADIITDASSTDSDTLNIALTSGNDGTNGIATVLNIENINANLTSFGAVTFDAKNIKGAKLVTVNQAQAGSTGAATVSNLTGGTNVTAGSGVVDLTVNYATTGSGATVVGSKGAVVTAIGTASVTNADNNGVKVNISASGTTQAVTLSGAGHTTNGVADDAATVIGSGRVAVTNDTGTNAIESLTLQASGAAATFTLTGTTTKIILAGDQNNTVKVTADAITGRTVTDSTTAGTSTTEVTTKDTDTSAGLDTVDLTKVATDKILLSTDVNVDDASNTDGDFVQVKSGASVDVTATQTGAISAKGTASANSLTVSTLTKTGAAAGDSYTLAGITNADAVTLNVGENTTVTTFGATTVVVTATGSEALTLGSSASAKSVDASAMTGTVTATLNSNLLTLTSGSGKDTVTGVDAKMVLDTGAGTDTLKFASTTDLSDNTGVSIKGVDILAIDDDGSTDVTLTFAGSQVNGSAWAVKGELNGSAKDTVRVFMDDSSLNLSNWSIDASTIGTLVIDGHSNAIAGSAATTEGLTITATAGVDSITVGNNGSTVNAGAGADTVTGGTGADTINGGSGADTIDTSAGNDTINGDAGADKITAGSGNDVVNGGDDADAVDGGAGNDTINGDAGGDTLAGLAGADTISGGAGNDTIIGGAGADTLNGGDGFDTFVFTNQGTTAISTVSSKEVVTLGGTYYPGQVINIVDIQGANPTTTVSYTVKAGDGVAEIGAGLVAAAAAQSLTYTYASSAVTTDSGTANDVTATITGGTLDTATSTGVTVSGTTVTGFDKITGFSAAEDSIFLGASADGASASGSTAIAGAQTAAATAGVNAKISTAGVATFAAEDDTLAEMVTTLAADTGLTDGEVVIFEFGGNTYVYGANDTSEAATDYLIELTGVVGLGAASISSGTLTFA